MMTSSSDELLQRGVEPVIAVENLRVVRGKRPAIHDLSVQIARGSITGLLGPSGCGKTTLMRSVVGTQIITAGTVTVLGYPAGSASLRKRVGYILDALFFANPNLSTELWFNILGYRSRCIEAGGRVAPEVLVDFKAKLELYRGGTRTFEEIRNDMLAAFPADQIIPVLNRF